MAIKTYKTDDPLSQKYDCDRLFGSVEGKAGEEPARAAEEELGPQQLRQNHRSPQRRRKPQKNIVSSISNAARTA